MYKHIRDLREDSNLSQSDMADMLNVNRATYSRYETGERGMPIDCLVKIAIFHNTSVDYLLDLTDIKDPYPRAKKKE